MPESDEQERRRRIRERAKAHAPKSARQRLLDNIVDEVDRDSRERGNRDSQQ